MLMPNIFSQRTKRQNHILIRNLRHRISETQAKIIPSKLEKQAQRKSSTMASSTIINFLHTPTPHHRSSTQKPSSSFLSTTQRIGSVKPCNQLSSKLERRRSTGATCWFKFGKNGVDAKGAGIYGSQSRNDFDRDDVEQYFNYMGMLAVEGTYDKMEALLNLNIHPVDILLLMAASEGDKPKIEELLRAGANYDVKDVDGRTALDRASDAEIRDFILNFSAQRA